MKLEYRVHGVSDTLVTTSATVEGEEQSVHVKGLTVELASVNGRMGSPTLNFIGKEVAEARELFKVDDIVELVRYGKEQEQAPAKAKA